MSPFNRMESGRLAKIMPNVSLSQTDQTSQTATGASRGENSGSGFHNSPVISYAIGQGATATASPSADGSSKWLWIGLGAVAIAAGLWFWFKNRK